MSKLKSKKYKTKVQNPTGIPCDKDSELYLEHYSTSDAESIAEKLKSPCAEDREIGAMILANMASNQQLITNLIEKKIIRVAAPLLIDKSPNVRHAIAGSLRMSEQRHKEQRKQIWSSISMVKAVEAIRDKKMHWKEAAETFNVPEIILLKLFEEKYGNPKVITPSNITDPTILKSKYEYKNEGSSKQLAVQEWSLLYMAEAIKAIKNEKISWKYAARMFGVPKATLAKLLGEIFGNSGSEKASRIKRDCPASFELNGDKFDVEDNNVQHICSSSPMDRAIKAVKEEKMGWKKAAKTFKVPKATLKRKLYENHVSSCEESKALLRPILNGDFPVIEKQAWSPESLEKALKAVKEDKIGWKKAAKTFGVPKATLKRLLYEKADSCPAINSPTLGDFDNKDKYEQGLIKMAWSPESMKKALEAVITEKLGLKEASKTFEVPKTTLRLLLYVKYGLPNKASQASISCLPINTPTIGGNFDVEDDNSHQQVKQAWSPRSIKEMLEALKIKKSRVQKAAEALGVPKFILMRLLCKKCGIPKRASEVQLDDEILKTVKFNIKDQWEQQEIKQAGLSESAKSAVKTVKALKIRWRVAAKIFGVSKAALRISLCDKNSISGEESQVRMCCSEVLTSKQDGSFKIRDGNKDQLEIEQSSSPICVVQSLEEESLNGLRLNEQTEITEVNKKNLKRLFQDDDIIGDKTSAKTKCLSIRNSEEKFNVQDGSEEQHVNQAMATGSTMKVIEAVKKN